MDMEQINNYFKMLSKSWRVVWLAYLTVSDPHFCSNSVGDINSFGFNKICGTVLALEDN